MIKKDLINKIAALGFTRKQAKEAMGAIIEGVGESLARGEKVQIQGLGTFEVRITKVRRGRNPKTGEPLEIPPRRVPTFRSAPILRAKIKET